MVEVDSNPSNRDMSPLTDVDTESYPSEEDTDDGLRTFSSEEGDDNEYMIKTEKPNKTHHSAEEISQQRRNRRLDVQISEDNCLASAIFHEVSASGSNVPIGNSDIGRHPSGKSKTEERIPCNTGGSLPSSGVPQRKKIRDIKLYLPKEQCHKLWVKHRERLGYRGQTMTESMSSYRTNVLTPLLKALLDEPDDVIFSARAMPSEEYEQLLFLEYPWLEQRIHTQSTFPSLWSLRAPIFDTACSKCRKDNIRCEARAIGACIDDPAGRTKYYGLSCKYCLASNKRGCDAWMHCWDVPYPLWSPRSNHDSGLKRTEGQLVVKGDMKGEQSPEKQECTIAATSPMSSTMHSNPPLFLGLRACAEIWQQNQHRLGYRERLVSESLDDYISNVLAPLRDAILIEPDDIVFSARAMSYYAYKRLLLLEYSWLEVTEAKYPIGDRAPSLKHWSLKAPIFDDACARCRRDNIRCEARAIGVPIHDPQGYKKYTGLSLSCKYCAAIRATPCGAWMRCWGDSNPWVATEDVMNTDLKHEKVRMRVKSTQEAQSKPVQKQTVQKVQVDTAPQMNKVSRVSRQEHVLELARKMDKAEWEKERELVRDSAIARSSMLLADAGLQVGLHQELQPVPSISPEKQHFLGENLGRTQWIDRSAVDVQMQELPVNPTFSLSMPDVDKIVRVDEDSGHKFPAAKGFDSFSTSHPSNQSLSADLIFSDPQPSELVRDAGDSPAYGDNMHHSNDSYDHTGLRKRTFETAFSADTIHESDADAQSLSYPLPTAELLRAKTSIEHENIEEDLSLRPFESEETPESTSGDPLKTSLAKLKETFIDVVRQLQADKADLMAELEASKMYSKRLEESEARYRQENFQLNAEKRQLEESLKQSLLKGAEADERLRFVHWIVEETRRNRRVPNA